MRLSILGFSAAALLVASGAAAEGGVGGKGDIGGKGGAGPSSGQQPTTTDSGQSVDVTETSQRRANPDVAETKPQDVKPWEIGASFETHRLLYQDDLEGAAVNKVFNVYFLSARYDLTDDDRITAGWGVTQAFLADDGESGFRGTDITVAYTHTFHLPERVLFSVTPATTIPISYYSQLASTITAPSLTASLSRRFGDLTLAFRVNGGAFIDKYAQAGSCNAPDCAGGSENPKWHLGGSLTAEYSIPFHRPLSIGAALSDSYVWFYDGTGQPVSSANMGAVQDSQFASQPMLQSYGGEIFARYILPTLGGFKSDIAVALAQGDPSLGYPSVLHDGIVHPYLLYRGTEEVYAAFSVRY
jgi:hypothetical protein